MGLGDFDPKLTRADNVQLAESTMGLGDFDPKLTRVYNVQLAESTMGLVTLTLS